MEMTEVKGVFVVVEGPDGAGKSTLAGGLVRRTEELGRRVIQVREPGGTAVAERARDVVLDPALSMNAEAEMFLYLAARADLVEKVIRPALREGTVVISDRFYMSTLAYQGAGRGLPLEEVKAAVDLATGGLTPDATLVIDVPPDIGRKRMELAGRALDRLERADEGFHKRVYDYFGSVKGDVIHHIDGNRDAGEVERDAWGVIRPILGD